MHVIKAFKNLRDAQIDFDRPLTLLIGRNGAGKSNLVEAIELLARLARGISLHEIGDTGRGGFQVRGGLRGCLDPLSHGIELGVRLGQDLYSVTIRANGQPFIAAEHGFIAERIPFLAFASADGALVEVEFDNFDKGPNKPRIKRPSDRTVLSNYEILPISKQTPARRETLERLIRLRSYLQAASVFDPQPRLMRSYERVGDNVLASDGHNLSAALFALHEGRTPEDKQSIEQLLACMRQLPEEPFTEFKFERTKLDDVIFGLASQGSTTMVDARLLSDGTLRCLAILVALATAPHESRIMIEEFDNGLHPSRVHVLTAAIQQIAARRTLNVLCTTQNPATLNALSPEQLEGVVVCHWRENDRSSTLTPLLQVPGADILLERGQLGDLVTRRILEEHLMPGFEEARQADARKWLETLP